MCEHCPHFYGEEGLVTCCACGALNRRLLFTLWLVDAGRLGAGDDALRDDGVTIAAEVNTTTTAAT